MEKFKRIDSNSKLKFFITTQNDFLETMKSIKELENDFQIILQICQINVFLIIVETVPRTVPVEVKDSKIENKRRINYDC